MHALRTILTESHRIIDRVQIFIGRPDQNQMTFANICAVVSTIVGERLLFTGGLRPRSCLRLNEHLENEAPVIGTRPCRTINTFQQTLRDLARPDMFSVNLN